MYIYIKCVYTLARHSTRILLIKRTYAINCDETDLHGNDNNFNYNVDSDDNFNVVAVSYVVSEFQRGFTYRNDNDDDDDVDDNDDYSSSVVAASDGYQH